MKLWTLLLMLLMAAPGLALAGSHADDDDAPAEDAPADEAPAEEAPAEEAPADNGEETCAKCAGDENAEGTSDKSKGNAAAEGDYTPGPGHGDGCQCPECSGHECDGESCERCAKASDDGATCKHCSKGKHGGMHGKANHPHVVWGPPLTFKLPNDFELRVIGRLQVRATLFDMDDAEGAQMIVQSLEPMGCGSLTLEECLCVQAKAIHPEDPFFTEIITNHLGDFERRNYPAVARAMDMDHEDVVEYHKMLQRFEPWPGRAYTGEDPRYITPDVYLFQVGEEWQIVQNEDGLPKLRISPYYQRVLSQPGSAEEKKYIKGKLDSADFLIKSIYKRQATIYKVVKCILEKQMEFFEGGVEHLKPMILRDVADEVGVHESTVSRVTSNKYIQCPQGIFELKYFFNAGISQVHGEDVAAASVKAKIKQLIGAEDPRKPMSDAALAKELRKYNIACARRTVAKYREAMGILSSSKRKALF